MEWKVEMQRYDQRNSRSISFADWRKGFAKAARTLVECDVSQICDIIKNNVANIYTYAIK